MKSLTRKDQFDQEVDIHYSDLGKGQPVILLHGWPMSLEMWEYQIEDLVNSGLRVIKYDRRGFGKSSKPWFGYDYDTFTDDLQFIIESLQLQDVILVGFSMGGGEVARYFTRYGGAKVAKVVLLGAVPPFLLKTNDNPDGIERSVFEEMITGIKKDRIDFLDTFGKQFFGFNMISHPLSTPLLEYYRNLASVASQRSTVECVKAFGETDFRNDLKNINVPTLIIHGDADKIVPIEVSSQITAKAIKGSRLIVYEGAPHGFFYTDRIRLNRDLVQFITGSIPELFTTTQAQGSQP